MTTENRYPSTAHYDNGNYIPDPLNQPLKLEDMSAHDNGQLPHITSIQGYCTHKVLGGCPRCAEESQ